MWKNWFPFRRKEEKKEPSLVSSVTQKNGKENGSKREEGQFPAREGTGPRRPPVLDRSKALDPMMPGSTPRSPFTSRISYIESNETNRQDHVPPKHSVMNPSGPLLSTPLLPKIKRAIELNDSYSGRSSSPLTRNRVARSASVSYGPTHPTRSTPGRLPVVRLQRRQSLHLNRSNMQSPSTVKVAPPDPHLLSGPSFRVSPAPSVSPVKNPMVDTQTVISALRERSCRKRNTTSVNEDRVVEDEHTQMAKRRRQDSNLSTSSSVSIPSMPEILPDLSKQQDPFTTLQHIEQMAVKRPSAPRRGSFDDINIENPLPKRERLNNSSRILSSLSSSVRAAEPRVVKSQTTGQQPVTQGGKRTHSDSASVTNKDTAQPAKKLFPDLPATTAVETSRRVPAVAAAATTSSATPVVAKTKDLGAAKPASDCQEPQGLTPKRKIMLNVLEQASRQRSIYPSLARQATKPVMMASPADLEQDRKAEDERRVQNMLAFLDEDEEDGKADVASQLFPRTTKVTSTTSAAVAKTTAAATTAESKPTTTTAASLSQLLAAPLNTSQAATSLPTSTSTTTAGALPSSLFSLSTLAKSTAASVPAPTVGAAAGFAGSIAGLVQSSGASATSGLVSNKPICSTGSAGMFGASSAPLGTNPTPATATSAMSAAAALASLSDLVSSTATPPSSAPTTATAPLTVASHSVSANSAGASPPQYTFKPVFGAQASPPPPYPQGASKPQPAAPGFALGGAQPQSTTTIANPVPSLSGGFNFGSAASTQASGPPPTTTASASFSFGAGGAAPAPTTASGGGFSFGLAANTTSTAATAPQASAGFSFGATATKPTTQGSGSTGFSFGASNPPASTAAGFSFGQPAQQTSSSIGQGGQQNSSAPFGQTTQLSTAFEGASNSPKNFQPKNLFGTPKAEETQGASVTGGFGGFGAAPTPAGGFGQSAAATTAPSAGFSFGASTASSGASTFAFGQAAPGATGGFGANPAPTVTTSTGFSFGSAANTTANTAGAFSFGQKPTAPATEFSFAQAQPSTTTAPSTGFSFGQISGSAAPSGGFGFGAAATTAGSGFSFGGASSTATTAPSAGFSFGAAAASTTASSGGAFAFGGAGATNTASVFGQAKPQGTSQPAAPFGSTGAPGTFSFGGAQPQQPSAAAPAFGAQSQAPQAFGSTQQTSTPAFGGFGNSSATPTPGFSFSASSTPAKPAPAFGSSTPQPAPPAFGSSTPVPAFGANHSNSSTPVFGASANQNSSAASTTGFNFGASQASKSFSFGASANPAPSGGGAAFQFGQPGGNAGGTGGFNFTSSVSSPPQFNFGAGGGQPNMFTPGAGSTAPKPRAAAAARARRRGTRK